MADAGVLTDLDRALEATERVVAGIGPGQWSDATPCTELDVRGVLNHLVGGNLRFAAIVRGETGPDRSADVLGSDPLEAFRGAGQAMRQAFAAPGVLETTYTAPFGTGPGAVMVHVRIVETLVHGWDLARATAQQAEFPADVTERALALSRRQLTSRPAGAGAPFAAEVAVPAGAPAIDLLAGFLGRTT
jgi:uncharacterized protein (TIGR03086 family)